MRVISAILLLSVFISSAFAAGYTARANYGAKFEPKDKILHGAGQTYYDGKTQDGAFERYSSMMGADKSPIVFMDYINLKSPQSDYDSLRNRLDSIQATTGKYVIPQVGYYFPPGTWLPTESQISSAVTRLKSIGRPVYLRIGYEFNGTWYSPMYTPSNYIQTFRMLTDALRAANAPVATVWCAYPGYSSYYGSWNFLQQYYPGNDYVDWWSLDMFSASDITASNTTSFLNYAEQNGKPVMIGEATPRYIGADQSTDWNSWFNPFFNLIKTRKGIKGHTYIDWNWAGTDWPDWGDARLETGNATVRNNYIAEMSDPIYYHAGSSAPSFVVPEPGTIISIGSGLTLMLGMIARRKR